MHVELAASAISCHYTSVEQLWVQTMGIKFFKLYQKAFSISLQYYFEDRQQVTSFKRLFFFLNFSWFQFYVYTSCPWLCALCGIAPQTTVLNEVSSTRLSVKIALVSHWKWFLLNSFGKCVSCRRASNRCQRGGGTWERPLYEIWEYAFNPYPYSIWFGFIQQCVYKNTIHEHYQGKTQTVWNVWVT